MHILQIHNRYQKQGGEDAVVESERQLLEGAGHVVTQLIRGNETIVGFKAKASAAWNLVHSAASAKETETYLVKNKIDVVHVHNFFPLWTPSIFAAAKRCGVPTVLTLHNFRLMCANGLLLRDGKICEKCLGASPYQAVRHKCYRNSYLGTLAVARMISHHQRVGTWQNNVDQFIALTHFAKNQFVAAGLPEHKIAIKGNFCTPPAGDNERAREGDHGRRSGALFVGRLSAEKGVLEMLKAWQKKGDALPKLTLIGEGPLAQKIASMELRNVYLLGKQPKERVQHEMQKHQILVLPSICYETFSMVIPEAYASALPIIARDHGAMAELIHNEVTGLLYDGSVAALTKRVMWACAHRNRVDMMGGRARSIYKEKYTPATNLSQLIAIYEAVMT